MKGASSKEQGPMKFIKLFKDIRLSDVPQVGGKNASLGQMISQLSSKNIRIPDGFAITAQGYWYYLEQNNLLSPMRDSMAALVDPKDTAMLQKVGAQMRALILAGTMPPPLVSEIAHAYESLCREYKQENCDVAVRSSATAEDLPNASFAGQQETFLNVRGIDHLVASCKKSFASLFTDRAIAYRIDQGFDHLKVALSIGVQKMIRSDLACAGVAFSLDTETGFKDAIVINATYGLGEALVQGAVTPDEYVVYKPLLIKGYPTIIKKKRGDKQIKMIYAHDHDEIVTLSVSESESRHFVLSDHEIISLASMVQTIEEYYTTLKGAWCPMDIEWAKDGNDNQLYIVQARPETVHGSAKKTNGIVQYHLAATEQGLAQAYLLTAQSIGTDVVSGVVRVVKSVADIGSVQKGDILVTEMTDPDWVPAMKQAAGIVTERGGRTCHAAIVSRELKVPALVGAANAMEMLKTGELVTIDCSQGSAGVLYRGAIPFKKTVIELPAMPKLPVAVMVNIADPDTAFAVSQLPVAGVGLARLEFIISSMIRVHPMALLHPELINDAHVLRAIDAITAGYDNAQEFFVSELSHAIGMIAAAFYPKPVIVRFSDFKSNEYRNLIGGAIFEPVEENPMIGFRGASRYYDERYSQAFALECAAIKKVRETMGLSNLSVMVPFVRTLREAELVLNEMASHGLERGVHDLSVIMMCEIPANVILIDDFSDSFDGFSIGSNDLTQLTLGVDRDSPLLAALFNERDPAVKAMLSSAVRGAKRNHRHIGICGQAPSDYPEIANFLIEQGIDSLSLNRDSVIPFLMRFSSARSS